MSKATDGAGESTVAKKKTAQSKGMINSKLSIVFLQENQFSAKSLSLLLNSFVVMAWPRPRNKQHSNKKKKKQSIK